MHCTVYRKLALQEQDWKILHYTLKITELLLSVVQKETRKKEKCSKVPV